MKKLISCFNEHLKRIWLVIFAFVVFSNVNVFGLGNNVGHKLILNNFSETIVHKASTAEALRKTPLLFAYKPDTAYFLDDNEKVYMQVDKMPEFPGGLSGLQKFCSQNMYYPEQALTDNKSGIVRVGFIVGKDGVLRKARVVKSAGKELDEEAIRVVQKMPKWTPGELNGEKVPVNSVLPISFVKPAFGQKKNKPDTAKTKSKFTYVIKMPQFPGGDSALMQFLSDNVKYPIPAIRNNIQGTVMVGFVINEDGLISDIKVDSGIGGGCDEEAIRVVKKMPKWKPGLQNGKPAKIQFGLPIKFTLRSKN